MADEDIAGTWKETEKLLDKGKFEEALSLLDKQMQMVKRQLR